MGQDIGDKSRSKLRRVILVYLAVGVVWVVVSELLLRPTAPPYFNAGPPLGLMLMNRVIFVAVTAGIFYFIIRGCLEQTEEVKVKEQESTERARLYFESAASGLLVLDSEGKVLEVNPKALELFGYSSASELVGQPIEALVPEGLRTSDQTGGSGYFQAPAAGSAGSGQGTDPKGRRKNGFEFPIEVAVSSIGENADSHVFCSINDISERVQVQREARRAEMLSTLGAIAAGVAHDLNNPLAIIASRAELMLANGGQMPESFRGDLEVINRHAMRASRIAQDLLSLARQRPRAQKAINMAELVDRVLLLVRGQLRNEGISVYREFDADLPPVSGDAVALEQVLMNLLLNARDAMPGGGSVTIRGAHAVERPGWVQLVVADTGGGIPSDSLARIFEPGFTTKANGSGLGLWISRRVIRDHRGEINVESESGKGARFTILLPGAGGA